MMLSFKNLDKSHSGVWVGYCRQELICSYRTVPRVIWEIFSEFLIFCNLYSKNNSKIQETRQYLPILYEAMCDNYFIVKCLLKPHVARVIWLTSLKISFRAYNLMMNSINRSFNIVAILAKNLFSIFVFCQNCNYVRACGDTVHHYLTY